jgi:hypothetical protein
MKKKNFFRSLEKFGHWRKKTKKSFFHHSVSVLKNSSVREKECMLFRQLKKTLFKTGALK